MSCELQTPYDGDVGILLLVKRVMTIGKVKSLRLSQSFANSEEIFLLLLINYIQHVPSSNPVIELASDFCLAQSKTRPARLLDFFLQWQLNGTTIHGQKCRSTRTQHPDFQPNSLYYSSMLCTQQRSRIYLFYCLWFYPTGAQTQDHANNYTIVVVISQLCEQILKLILGNMPATS